MPTFCSPARFIELGWTPPDGYPLSESDKELLTHHKQAAQPKPIENGDQLISPTGQPIVGVLESMSVYREIDGVWFSDSIRYKLDYQHTKLKTTKAISIYIDKAGEAWFERDLVRAAYKA